MEADFNGLFCKLCEVARKTELISTALLWICFKEKKNTCKLVTQFLIISNKIMPKSTLFPSSVVKFTEKPWYLVVSLKTLYLKHVVKKHSTWRGWKRFSLFTEQFGGMLPMPKNWMQSYKMTLLCVYMLIYDTLRNLLCPSLLLLAEKIKMLGTMISFIPPLGKRGIKTENNFKIFHLNMLPGAISWRILWIRWSPGIV